MSKDTLRVTYSGKYMFTINKKVIFVFFIIFNFIQLHAADLSLLEGSWMPVSLSIDINYHSNNKFHFVDISGYKANPYDYIVIQYNHSPINNRTNFFLVWNAQHYIEKTEWIESERKFILSCRYYNYEYNEYDDTYELKEAHVISNYEIIYIDENEIQLCNFDGHKGPIKYYRIDGPAHIPPQNAILNDSRVRLRVKPNLTCDTWALLEKGTKCIIKDKSEKPFEIDGEQWYWYLVDADSYPDGWVYGKYLDIAQ